MEELVVMADSPSILGSDILDATETDEALRYNCWITESAGCNTQQFNISTEP